MSGSELATRAKTEVQVVKVTVMAAFDVDNDLKKAFPASEKDEFSHVPFNMAGEYVAVRGQLNQAQTLDCRQRYN
ncbi:MAG TPA: hypothetical protein VF172_06940 [Nitrososphaera sp.]